MEGPVVSYLTFGGGVRLFDLSIQLSVKWYIDVSFIVIYSKVNDFEHLFMCILAICMYSFMKCVLTFTLDCLFINDL